MSTVMAVSLVARPVFLVVPATIGCGRDNGNWRLVETHTPCSFRASCDSPLCGCPDWMSFVWPSCDNRRV